MRLIAIAALTVAAFITTMLVGYTQANAVVCAPSFYRPAVPVRMRPLLFTATLLSVPLLGRVPIKA
jgi:hypothetical protein